MAGDAFLDDEEDINGQKTPGAVSYASTGGTTPRGASPGFVNLGQMLKLNQASGQQSAKALNDDVTKQGETARQGIVGAEKSFMDASNGAVKQTGVGDNVVKARPVAAQGDYSGPTSLEGSGADMSKLRANVDAANTRASGLGSFSGVAAEAGRAQSLSPRQAATSAFYMGSANPMFKETTTKFGGLNQMLTDAQARAQAYGATGQDRVNEQRGLAQTKVDRFEKDQAQREQDAIPATLGMSLNEWIEAGKPQSSTDPKFTKWLAGGRAPGTNSSNIDIAPNGLEIQRREQEYGPLVSDDERNRRFQAAMRAKNPKWKPFGFRLPGGIE